MEIFKKHGACLITFVRIMLAPVVVLLMVQEAWYSAFWVFGAAVLTDVLDGFVARLFAQESKFGQLLDPVADKILLGSVLYTMLLVIPPASMFGWFQGFWWVALSYAVWFLLGKEIVLLAGGGVLWFGYGIFIRPSMLSRVVSLWEVLFVVTIFISKAFGVHVPEMVTTSVLGLNVLCSVWLLLRYAYQVWFMSLSSKKG